MECPDALRGDTGPRRLGPARPVHPARTAEADERDFFKDRLTRSEIEQIVALTSADEMFSWRSPSAKPFRQYRGKLSDERLIDLMLEEPRLIRRPILITDAGVLFGFDAEQYASRLS